MGEGAAERSNREWLDGVYDRLLVKMRAECARVGTNIPYSPGEDGMYHDTEDIAGWTNGFWPARPIGPPPKGWRNGWRRC